MGNVQASSITNQLLPFESYLNDVPEQKFKYLHGFGSTRFMKVARVEHPEGPMVAKIFIFADQSYASLIEIYKNHILQIKRKLQPHPNCCPFDRVFVTNRAVILCRPYQKHTLYDRMSTRPFLLNIEKKWIAFQLFKILAQCRIAMVKHGDIKSQNILVSSSLWIQLADFAPFKPTVLPSDDPSDFTYFFDTSRKRYCYLAPERFRKSDELNYPTRLPGDFANISEGLSEAMDIFSIGCVLLELLTDGRQIPFTLSQVIDYRRMDDHSARQYLRGIFNEVPEGFHELLYIMLDRNPNRRKDEYSKLNPCASDIFPPIFEKFLYRYVKEMKSLPTPDDIITKLYVEQSNYFQLLKDDKNESVVILIDLITSMLRGCNSLNSKMDSISLLFKLSKLISPSIILERIVPYLINLLNDVFPQIRSEAVHVLTQMLSELDSIPIDENRLLIDYIFPKAKNLISDHSTLVKISLASNLGSLAIVSKRFYEEHLSWSLDSSNKITKSDQDKSQTAPLLEEEKLLILNEYQALVDSVSELFVNLCGSENEVRICLFSPTNLDLICSFFGPDRATDVLMHMITLLNDKPDWRIRATFFESCPIIAKHLGRNRCDTLKPFLQQGLHDHEEFVVLKCLQCIYSLCNQQSLNKSTIIELVAELVPYLIHPNKWLRVAVVNILTMLDNLFPVSDTYCKLNPLVKFYLREDLIRLNDKAVFYESLIEPINRQMWDYILRLSYASAIIQTLENRKTLDKLGGGPNSLFSVASSAPSSSSYLPMEIESRSGGTDKQLQVDATIRNLKNIGMNEHTEDKLLVFKNIIRKIDLFRKSLEQSKNCSEFARIPLDKMPTITRRTFDLDGGILKMIGQSAPIREVYTTNSFSLPLVLGETLLHKQARYREQKRIAASNTEVNIEIVERIAAASIDIEDETTNVGAIVNGSSSSRPSTSTSSRLKSVRHKPKIKLLSHLHEHSGKITRMALHPDKNHFASSSSDKSVKIWSSNNIRNNRQPASMSKDILRYSHPITSCGFLGDSGGHLVMACGDASLQVFDIERKRLLKSHQLDREADGLIMDLYCYDHLIHVLTHHNSVYSFDLRMPLKSSKSAIELSSVWKRRTRNSYGLMTSFSVDSLNHHWMLLTASSATTKNMIFWDLRFGGLEVSSWSHPSDRIIPLRSWPFASGSRCYHAFTNCTLEGEISLWDLSTQSRTDVLWSGNQTPLTYRRELVSTALVPSAVDEDVVFTGDSEGSLRCWNLRTPGSSSYLCGPYLKNLSQSSMLPKTDLQDLKTLPSQIVYSQQKAKDSLLRIQVEDRSQVTSAVNDNRSSLHVNECHHDAITDLLSWPDFLVSSCRDGTIKLWKHNN